MNRGMFMTPGDEEQWTLSVQHTDADIDRYVEQFADFCASSPADPALPPPSTRHHSEFGSRYLWRAGTRAPTRGGRVSSGPGSGSTGRRPGGRPGGAARSGMRRCSARRTRAASPQSAVWARRVADPGVVATPDPLHPVAYQAPRSEPTWGSRSKVIATLPPHTYSTCTSASWGWTRTHRSDEELAAWSSEVRANDLAAAEQPCDHRGSGASRRGSSWCRRTCGAAG